LEMIYPIMLLACLYLVFQQLRSNDCAVLDNSSMALDCAEPAGRLSTSTPPVGQPVTFAPIRGATSTPKENENSGMQSIWASLRQRNVSSEAATIIMQSWADSSLKHYKPHLQAWFQLCTKWKVNPYNPPLDKVLDYLTTLYARGLKYDSINTAKSKISAIVEPSNSVTLANQPLISRFIRGVFRSRPPVPRYESTWDAQIVLSHLGSFAVASELNLKDLTQTLVMLMALVSAQRTQSLYLLDLNFMKCGTDMIEFAFPAHIKQSRQGYKNPTLQLKAYSADPKLCVVTHLQEYLSRTQTLRGSLPM